MTIDFPEPIHGVALGQVAAIWYQKWCIGSGVIERTWTADEVNAKSFNEMKKGPGLFKEVRREQVEEEADGTERVVTAS